MYAALAALRRRRMGTWQPQSGKLYSDLAAPRRTEMLYGHMAAPSRTKKVYGDLAVPRRTEMLYIDLAALRTLGIWEP